MCVTNTINRRPKAIVISNRFEPPTSNEGTAGPANNVANPSNEFPDVFAGIVSTYDHVNTYSCNGSSIASSSSSYWSDHSSVPSRSEEHQKPVAQKKRRRKPQKPGKTAKMNDRHFVVHNYHDHANDQPDESDLEQASKRRRGGGASMSFPLKLHAMLDQIEADGLAHVISWQPHGRAFLVHQPHEFVNHVMPTYFRQTKLTSFQRQLNLYGFCRLSRGADNRGYYHELFLRGKPFLCHRMVRTKVKGTKFKAASSPEEEPDFYQMPAVSTTHASVVTPPASSGDESGGDSDYGVQPCEPASSVMMKSPVASFDADFILTAPMSPISPAPTRSITYTSVPQVPSLEYATSPLSQEADDFSDEEMNSELLSALGMDEFVNTWGAKGGESKRMDDDEDEAFEKTLENDFQLGCLLQQFLTSE